jgi:hypothetical protein
VLPKKKGGIADIPPLFSPLPDPLKVARIVCAHLISAAVVIDTESPPL